MTRDARTRRWGEVGQVPPRNRLVSRTVSRTDPSDAAELRISNSGIDRALMVRRHDPKPDRSLRSVVEGNDSESDRDKCGQGVVPDGE